MNESLRRALLRARLSEEDVAARLQVNPKTVRRWLEGRVPYPRHRWLLAATLGLEEAELWPEVTAFRARPDEVRGFYSHRDSVPRGTWLSLFGSAVREISILDHCAQFIADDADILKTLADRAQANVKIQICLRDPSAPSQSKHAADGSDEASYCIRVALAKYLPLQDLGLVALRLHRLSLINSIYRADGNILMVQHAYGVRLTLQRCTSEPEH